jgi:hypothetical protein
MLSSSFVIILFAKLSAEHFSIDALNKKIHSFSNWNSRKMKTLAFRLGKTWQSKRLGLLIWLFTGKIRASIFLVKNQNPD